jgi:hypothetical protein
LHSGRNNRLGDILLFRKRYVDPRLDVLADLVKQNIAPALEQAAEKGVVKAVGLLIFRFLTLFTAVCKFRRGGVRAQKPRFTGSGHTSPPAYAD